MANLVEVDNYDAGIYQLETTDPVQGGAGGIDNAQAQSLANRTKNLKGRLDAIVTAAAPDTIVAGVLHSSLTSVGVLAAPHMTSPVVNSGGITVTAGSSSLQAVTFTTATGSGVLTITSGGIAVTGNSTITGTLGGISTLTATTFVGALTGNASSANILLTPRAINGVNFDGSGPITVTAAAGTLTGATLNATVTASSLTSVGVLASPHMTGAVVDSGGFTVTAGTSSLQAVTCTTLTGTGAMSGFTSGTFSANVIAGAGNTFAWTGRSSIWSPSDGIVLLQNAASTDFVRLQFGGTTAAFPSLRRATTRILFRLADDSGYAGVECGSLQADSLTITSGTTSVQTLTATLGSLTTGVNLVGDFSNTLEASPYIQFRKNDGTRRWYLQADAGNALRFWYYDGSSFANAIFNTAGGLTLLAGVSVSSGTSSFQGVTATSGVFSSGVQIGGGATVTKWLTATFSWLLNFSSGWVSTTVSVPGAAVGDLVVIDNPFVNPSQSYSLDAAVSAADTVKLRAFCFDGTGSSSTQTIRIFVVKF